MDSFFLGHYAYWLTMLLLCVGMYGILFKQNLVKKLIGMSILQSAVILFYVSMASKWNATVPVVDPAISNSDAANYLNALPHTLMLTAIVVGVATMGVGFTLLISIYNRYHTLEEDVLMKEIQ